MSSSSDSPRLRLYLLHRWAGLLLAVLTVPIIFSGAIATFHDEIDAWTSRGHHHAGVGGIPGFDLDETYARAATGVPERQQRRVNIWQDPGHPLQFFFFETVPGEGDIGVAATVDPAALDVLRRRSGERLEATAPPPALALSRFFVDLHIFFLLPRTPGLILTGIAGLALLALLAAGMFFYPPTRRNLMRRPRTDSARLLTGNLHAIVGAWSLPFTLIMAATGAFFPPLQDFVWAASASG